VLDQGTLKKIADGEEETLFRNRTYLAMFRAIKEQAASFSLAKYVGELPEKEAEIASAILREEDALENADRAADDCIKRLAQENDAEEILRLQAELKRPDLTAEERNAVLKEITSRIRANK
jgi:hypothetical protein